MKRGPGSFVHEWLLTSSTDDHNAILFCELQIWKLSSVCEYRCFLNKNTSTSNSRFLKLLPHRIISNLVETTHLHTARSATSTYSAAASVLQDGNVNQLKRDGVQEPHANFILAMAQRSSTFTPCRFAWGINGGCSICVHLIYGLHELGGIGALVSRRPGVKVCGKTWVDPETQSKWEPWTWYHLHRVDSPSHQVLFAIFMEVSKRRRHEGRWLGCSVSAMVQTDVTRKWVRSGSGKCKSLVWTLLFVVKANRNREHFCAMMEQGAPENGWGLQVKRWPKLRSW